MKVSEAQNPYVSCYVQASAGSGKTYQLSRRFFSLVNAGADPTHIVCVTFTNLAAMEMRERILKICHDVLHDERMANDLDAQNSMFFKQSENIHKNTPPRKSVETANLILSKSQSLSITTIDALAWEWVRRFPAECGLTISTDQGNHIPAAMELDTSASIKTEAEHLRDQILRSLAKHPHLSVMSWLAETKQDEGYMHITRLIESMSPHHERLERARQSSGTSSSAITPWAGAELGVSDDELDQECLQSIGNLLRSFYSQLNDEQQRAIDEASSQGKVEVLVKSTLISASSMAVSKRLKKSIREGFAHAISEIDEALAAWDAARKLRRLNEASLFLSTFFDLYAEQLATLKKSLGSFSFSDLAPLASRIFTGPDNAGARYMLTREIQHLLLDEFQDTSRMQWDIYRTLCDELLSTESKLSHEQSLASTVFLVGDRKQSIYGFRGADPTLCDEADHVLNRYGVKVIAMDQSFRSSAGLVDFFNAAFSDKLDGFRTHTASQKNSPASVTVLSPPQVAMENSTTQEERMEAEAHSLAHWLSETLEHRSHEFPVFDKSLQSWRPLQAGDCAILYRKSTHAALFELALREKGLHTQREGASGFYDRQEIQDLMALIKWLALPFDRVALLTVLSSPLAYVEESILWQVLHELRSNGTSTKDFEQELFLEALKRHRPQIVEKVYEWRTRSERQSPLKFLSQLCFQDGAIASYKDSFETIEGSLALAHIQELLEVTEHAARSGGTDMLKLHGYLEEQSKLNRASAFVNQISCIQMMTLHKSKGLEFPLVIVIDSAQNWNKMDPNWAIDPDDGSQLVFVGRRTDRPVQSPLVQKMLQQMDQQNAQESLRMLYVAWTRARHHLCICGAPTKQDQSFWHLAKKALANFSPAVRENEAFISEEWIVKTHDHSSVATPVRANTINAPLPQPSEDELIEKNTGSQEILCLRSNQRYSKDPISNEHSDDTETIATDIPGGLSARLYGVLLHRLLEKSLRKFRDKQSKDFNYQFTINECQLLIIQDDEGAKILRTSHSSLFPELMTHLHLERDSVVNSKFFRDLIESHQTIYTEVPYVERIENEMISGQIDLLVVNHLKQATIIDWKTAHHLPKDISDEKLKQWAVDKGYESQLQRYDRAIRSTQAHRSLRKGIFVTNLSRWIEL